MRVIVKEEEVINIRHATRPATKEMYLLLKGDKHILFEKTGEKESPWGAREKEGEKSRSRITS